MAKLTQILALIRNRRGQDLIEYALMAGFVAVAAGAFMPDMAAQASVIFSKVVDILYGAASQGFDNP